MNSPTAAKSLRNTLTSASPSQRNMKSPIMDRAANTKAILKNNSTFKSTKVKTYFTGYQSM